MQKRARGAKSENSIIGVAIKYEAEMSVLNFVRPSLEV